MHLSHPVEGGQLDDCGATARYCGKVKAVAKGLSKSKGSSFATGPAVSRLQLCKLVRWFSLPDEFTLPAVIGWIRLLRIETEFIPTRRREPAEKTSKSGQAN